MVRQPRRRSDVLLSSWNPQPDPKEDVHRFTWKDAFGVLIILAAILIVSSLGVRAAGNVTTNASEIARWSFENTTASAVNSSNILTASGSISYQNVNIGGTVVTAINITGGAYLFNNTPAGLFNTAGGSSCGWVLYGFSSSNQIVYGFDNYNSYMHWGWMNSGGVKQDASINGGALITKSAGPPTVGNWYFICFVQNESGTSAMYTNARLNTSDSGTTLPSQNGGSNIFRISGTSNFPSPYEGLLYCFRSFNGTLSDAQMATLYNGGVPTCTALSFGPPAPLVTANFSVTVNDAVSGSALVGVTANLSNGSSSALFSNATGNLIQTTVVSNFTSLFNITVTGSNHFAVQYLNFNITGNLVANLSKTTANVSYAGNISINSTSFVRNLSYTVTVAACQDNNLFELLVNGQVNASSNFSCASNASTITGTYNAASEYFFNTSFRVSGANSTSVNLSNSSFFSDIYAPNASVNASVTSGFYQVVNFNVSLTCTDSAIHNLSYLLTANSVNLFSGNLSSGTVQRNITTLADGANTIVGTCNDFFGATVNTTTFTAYSKNIILWDEVNNVAFNASSIAGAKLWFGDNASYYDFKANSRGNISFINTNSSQLRIVLSYLNGDDIIRYVDVSLLTDSQIKVCANPENTTFFQQLLQGSSSQPVVVQNVYSKCVVAADYLRFAFQDALTLNAFTINSLYYLYTYDSTNQVLLASIDGGTSTDINVDVLKFKQQGYNLNVLGDTITFENVASNEVLLYYQNLQFDNTALSMTIKRMDTGETVLTNTTFADPNQFTLYFNFATLQNVTNTTLFSIELSKTKSDGTIGILRRYFNPSGGSGVMPAVMGFVLSLILTVFGLSFASFRITLGWFGMFIILVSLAILAFSTTTWFTLMLMAMEVILLLYIFISMIRAPVLGMA